MADLRGVQPLKKGRESSAQAPSAHGSHSGKPAQVGKAAPGIASASPQLFLFAPFRQRLLPSKGTDFHAPGYRASEMGEPVFFTGSSILAQAQRQKFLEGRGAGRENLFPKRFPSPQAFLPSNFQAPACRPQNKKIPGGAGTKKDPLALRAARGSRTIFGSGLLSHMTLCSIIGDGELNFRVRNGVGCTLSSMATKEIW